MNERGELSSSRFFNGLEFSVNQHSIAYSLG